MTDDRRRRFWTRVGISLALALVLYVGYCVYALLYTWNSFSAAIRD